MTELKRWLDDSELANSLEARVLSAGKDIRAPSELEPRAWAEFSAMIAPAAGMTEAAQGPSTPNDGVPDLPAATTAAGHAAATTSLTLLKSLGVGVILGVTGIAAFQRLSARSPESDARSRISAPSLAPSAVLDRSRAEPLNPPPAATALGKRDEPEAPSTPSERAPSAPSKPASPPARSAEPASSPGTSAVPARAAFPDVSPQSTPSPAPEASSRSRSDARDNQLAAEALELARAKNLLAEGRALEAERLLEGGDRRFPAGALGHERELLRVTAWMRLGKLDLARQRAHQFISQFPNSPLADRMRHVAGVE